MCKPYQLVKALVFKGSLVLSHLHAEKWTKTLLARQSCFWLQEWV